MPSIMTLCNLKPCSKPSLQFAQKSSVIEGTIQKRRCSEHCPGILDGHGKAREGKAFWSAPGFVVN